jgi:two-component system OmpR family response regulator
MDLLLLEDDADLGRAVVDHLAAAGHRVHWCRRIAEAQAAPAPDLALLDLQLPDGDGLALLRHWRGDGAHWPVIVLTARDQVSDRIRGLQAGADDYLVKPFDLDELLARIDAVVRRSALVLPTPGGAGLRIDPVARQVWLDGEQVALTQMEWAVLASLARRPGRIYSRDEIENQLHARGLADAASNSLEVIVSRLRKKLGAGTISTHRGLGYRLEA